MVLITFLWRGRFGARVASKLQSVGAALSRTHTVWSLSSMTCNFAISKAHKPKGIVVYISTYLYVPPLSR